MVGRLRLGGNQKTEYYQVAVTGAMKKFFPLIRVRRKTSDCPWIINKLRRLISRHKGIYRREGRSAKWRHIKNLTDELLLNARNTTCRASKMSCLWTMPGGIISAMSKPSSQRISLKPLMLGRFSWESKMMRWRSPLQISSTTSAQILTLSSPLTSLGTLILTCHCSIPSRPGKSATSRIPNQW